MPEMDRPMLAYHRLSTDKSRLKNHLRTPSGNYLLSKARINSFFKADLYSKCDGVGLAQSSGVPIVHSWVADGTNFMSGSDNISAIQARYNCLFSRSRGTRGRDLKYMCARGCAQPETLNHMTQQCYASHGLRIRRHDDVCLYVIRSLQQKGFSVQSEPRFPYNHSFLKPDIVAYNSSNVFIIDFQVINDQFNLDLAHCNKVEKYSVLRPQLDPLRPNGSIFTSITVNWRGLVSPKSFASVTGSHLLRPGDFRVISARVLAWTRRLWRAHQSMSRRSPPRKNCQSNGRVP